MLPVGRGRDILLGGGGIEQLDLAVDVDYRPWNLQFIPYLRPNPTIYYAKGREAPAWAGVEPGDQLSYSSWEPGGNQFKRCLILIHTLWPVRASPIAVGELQGKVLEMPFFTVDAHAVDGEQITYAWDHDNLGTKEKKGSYEVTQCPWLLPQDAWLPFIDQQRREVA